MTTLLKTNYLQTMTTLFVYNKNSTQIKLYASRNFLGVIRKLEKESKFVSVSTKMYPMFIEFLSLKLKRLSSLKLIKEHAHEDDNKSFDRLTFP